MTRDQHEHDGIVIGMVVVNVAEQEDGSFLTLQCPVCHEVVHLEVVEARMDLICESDNHEGQLAEPDFSVVKAPPNAPIVKRSRALAEEWARKNGFANLEAYFDTPEGSVWKNYDFAP
jgi:hypothetical protein